MDAEVDHLRRELDFVQKEAAQLRSEATRNAASRQEPEEFVQARLAVAQKLTERRIELDRREQAIAEREASLPHLGAAAGQRFMRFMQDGAGQRTAHQGGSGIPESPVGGLFGLLERVGCARRQTQTFCYTGVAQ